MHQSSLLSAKKSISDEDRAKNKTHEDFSNELLIFVPNRVSGFTVFNSTDSTSNSTSRVSSSSNAALCRYIMLPNVLNPNHILAVTESPSPSPSSSQGLLVSRRCVQPLISGIGSSSFTIEHAGGRICASQHSISDAISTLIPNSRSNPRIRQIRPLLQLAQGNDLQIESHMRLMRHIIMESVLYTRRPRMLEFNSLTAQNGAQDVQVSRQQTTSYVSEMDSQYADHIWLDVDNMSYEELLALEDHIGYVSTGLSEDAIVMSLKHSKYFVFEEENAQRESCSICQETYMEGDELGKLDCGHGFHIGCINRWLTCKNSCPICKSTGLGTCLVQLGTFLLFYVFSILTPFQLLNLSFYFLHLYNIINDFVHLLLFSLYFPFFDHRF